KGYPDGPIPPQNGPVSPWNVGLFDDIINEELPPPGPEELGFDKIVMVPPSPEAQAALVPPSGEDTLPAGFLAQDLDNARRFTRQHGEDVRYVIERNAWLVWNGARWIADAETLERRAKQTIDALYKELAQVAHTLSDKALAEALKDAKNARQAGRMRGMLKFGQSEPGIAVRAADLDADPWSLGVQNGVVDLKTGEFREMRRDDYITKFAGTDFVSGAQCPNWEAFLLMVMDDDRERVEYLQRFAGYMLTGSLQEEAVLLLFGVGRNGKSTFREVLSKVIGNYALTCSAGLLMEQRQSNAASPEVAALKGVRLAAVNETAEDGVLREERLKFIASNEPITARYLYENDFQFLPTHKLIVTTN